MSNEQPKESWFKRVTKGLARTSTTLTSGLADLIVKKKLDEATLEDLESLLIRADFGTATAIKITDELRKNRYNKEIESSELNTILASHITEILTAVEQPLEIDQEHKPFIILMVGVNGTGKTTTIGKLAAQFTGNGKTVMLAAGDTFRAAAVEQLKVWGERTNCQVIAKETGADASGLVYEAVETAINQSCDILMIDTAGRLQNKTELMDELAKLNRVIKKLSPTGPHAVLLVLDATTGQNALSQVEHFKETADVTGLVMTKLDGTAKGGILVALAEKYQLPVHYIGIGEGINDLNRFEAETFAKALINPRPL